MARLGRSLEEGDATVIHEKRRYCIPLDRLKVVAPWLDLARVRDVSQRYQPFIPIDPEWPFHRFGTEARDQHGFQRFPANVVARPPLNVHGLVFDKATMRYI